MSRRAAMSLILVGVLLQLGGLALDAVLHARDATLVMREGVLTLTNPGHALVAVGLALCVLGLCAWLLDGLPTRRGAGAVARAATPAVALLLLAGGSFAVAARSGGLTGHPHAHEDGAHAHPATDTLAPISGAASSPVHSHTPPAISATGIDQSRHDHGVEIRISWEQLRAIDAMLTAAKAATEPYRDVAVARAAGYVQVTQVIPGLGAHFLHPGLQATGTFDVERPPILLYDRADGGAWELVGVSWTLPKQPGEETPPASPFGALAVWHYHTNLCFGLRTDGPTVNTNTAAGCRAAGGLFVRETPWMVHAWLFRPSPEGVFSHENSTIRGAPAIAAGP